MLALRKADLNFRESRNIYSISRLYWVLIIPLSTSVFLAGCAGRLRPAKRLTLAVNISADANRDSPVALDFVSTNDKDLSKDISKMTAADWFQKRDQILRDFPKASSISVRSWEWVPGQVVPDLQIPLKKTPRALFIFANYSTPGPHRGVVDASKAALLTLGREDIQLGPLAK